MRDSRISKRVIRIRVKVAFFILFSELPQPTQNLSLSEPLKGPSPMPTAQISQSRDAGAVGDIHDPAWLSFWESLKPGTWVQSLLAEGYKIPLSDGEIPQYRENNNATAERPCLL